MMKKFLLATVGSVALLGMAVPALAADMAVKAPPPAPLPVIYDWSGFYIGANGARSRAIVAWISLMQSGQISPPVAVIVPEAKAGKSGIAGKPMGLCSDWKHKAIGPTSAALASACSTRRSQPT